MGWTYLDQGWYFSFGEERAKFLATAVEMARQAIALNETLAEPYALLGRIHLVKREHKKALAFGQRAVDLNPNAADGYAFLASTLSYSGKPEQAMVLMKKAMRFNPFPPDFYLAILGQIHYQQERYGEAIRLLQEIRDRNPHWEETLLLLMASYGAAGRELPPTLEMHKSFTPEPMVRGWIPLKIPADTRRLVDDLVRAGMKR